MSTPRLAAICEEINRRFPEFEASMESWMGSFDRHPKGVRWRIPGKLRSCKVLTVHWRDRRTVRAVYSHNPLEAYRRNSDVIRWMEYEAPKILAAEPSDV